MKISALQNETKTIETRLLALLALRHLISMTECVGGLLGRYSTICSLFHYFYTFLCLECHAFVNEFKGLIPNTRVPGAVHRSM